MGCNKISVALATYNGQKYITSQLMSILSQLGDNDEIIISDNYSTDDTIQIIQSFNDKRIKIFYQKQVSKSGNANCIKNFENALLNCTGDYIFLSDQDDIWIENKVSLNLNYLKQYDIVVSDCKIIDDQNRIILESYFKRRNSGRGLIKNVIANTYLGCCMAFKKQVLLVLMPFPAKIPMHDIFIGFAGELFYKTLFATEQLVLYRDHGSNVSPTAVGITKYGFFAQIGFRWNIIRYIPLLFYRKFFK